jgi:hypothetical protein
MQEEEVVESMLKMMLLLEFEWPDRSSSGRQEDPANGVDQ